MREARVCHGQAHSSDSRRKLLAARGLQRLVEAHGHGVLHRLGKRLRRRRGAGEDRDGRVLKNTCVHPGGVLGQRSSEPCVLGCNILEVRGQELLALKRRKVCLQQLACELLRQGASRPPFGGHADCVHAGMPAANEIEPRDAYIHAQIHTYIYIYIYTHTYIHTRV